MDIDFVITWVDMEDPAWQEGFAKYSNRKENEKNGVSEARFRDYGFLRYWFRGVEKFAPWVRKIHFVASGQKPEWLDLDHPKIHWVDHKDFIPGEFLPIWRSILSISTMIFISWTPSGRNAFSGTACLATSRLFIPTLRGRSGISASRTT